MALKTNIFSERVGILRILSIVFSVIAIILVERYYYNQPREEAFYYGNIVCLCFSCLFFLMCLLGVWDDQGMVRQLDKLFHCAGAILMIVASAFFIYAVHDTRNNSLWPETQTAYDRRAAGAAFGLFYGLTLAWIGFLNLGGVN